MSQVLVNSIIYASEIGIIALGISLSYSILRFANFAHIQFAVIGGYLTYVAYELIGLPIVAAAAFSLVLTGLIAVLADVAVFRALRTSSAESKMIASWGVALFLRSIVAVIFGGSALGFEVSLIPFDFAGALFTSLDVIVVGVTIVAMIFLHQILQRTRLGTALRALACNFELAETRGIPSERMIKLMWFMVGAYAALGGTLLGIETQLRPSTDLYILLPVFAAATIGGLGNIFGAVLGAVILSLAQNILISVDFGMIFSDHSWYLPSQQRDFIAVAALILVLLFRPHGVVGRKMVENR